MVLRHEVNPTPKDGKNENFQAIYGTTLLKRRAQVCETSGGSLPPSFSGHTWKEQSQNSTGRIKCRLLKEATSESEKD